MVISTDISSQTFLGNGVTTVFTCNFVPDQASNIVVSLSTGSTTSAIIASNLYTVSLSTIPTGEIWPQSFTVTYPLIGSPISNTTYLTVSRILPFTQDSSFNNQGNLYPQAIEGALDTLEMQIQQLVARTTQWRGIWATNIYYNVGDIVQDSTNGNNTNNYYICVIANTSGTWSTDLTNGDWAISVYAIVPTESFTLSGAVSGTGTLGSTIPTTINAGAISSATYIAAAIITGTQLATNTVTGTNLATNTVTNANLAQMAGNTVKMNSSASLANGTDYTLLSGQTLGIGTSGTIQGQSANFYTHNTTSPSGRTSTTAVLMGLAGIMTPSFSGDVSISICGSVINTNPGGGFGAIYYGTGSAPSNGATISGTKLGGGFTWAAISGNGVEVPFNLSGIASSLTLGTAYWVDMSLGLVTATGTVSVSNVTINAFEIK